MIEFSEAGMAKAQIILKLSFFMPKNSSSCECKVLEGNLKCSSQLEVSRTFSNHLVTVKMGGLTFGLGTLVVNPPPRPSGAALPIASQAFQEI